MSGRFHGCAGDGLTAVGPQAKAVCPVKGYTATRDAHLDRGGGPQGEGSDVLWLSRLAAFGTEAKPRLPRGRAHKIVSLQYQTTLSCFSGISQTDVGWWTSKCAPASRIDVRRHLKYCMHIRGPRTPSPALNTGFLVSGANCQVWRGSVQPLVRCVMNAHKHTIENWEGGHYSPDVLKDVQPRKWIMFCSTPQFLWKQEKGSLWTT